MTIDFTVVLPELIIAITALVVLLADLYLPRSQRVLLAYLTLIGMMAAMIDIAVQHDTTKVGFNYNVVIDGFSLFSSAVLLVVGMQTVLLSMDYLELEHINLGEYYVLLLGALGGMMLMAAANSLIVVFVALETFSICLYVLCGFERTREKSLESAIKYFLLSAFASAFLLYGMALTYGATGSTIFTNIASFLKVHGAGGDPILIAGMGLMIVGLGFKMSAVPFHSWVPDVYEGAPSPVTAMMSVGTKLAAFSAFVRLFVIALPALHANWSALVWLLAVFTMVGGNVAAVVQTNVKRMLAYSSIAQAGYILIAVFTARGTGKAGDGVPSLLFYFLIYTFMNLGAFGVVTAIGRAGEDNTMLRDFAGLGRRMPWLAVAMAVFMFSLAGFPPTAGLWAKLYVFQTALQQGHGELAVIGVLCSLVSVYYYLRVVYYMYLRPAADTAPVLVLPPALNTTVALSLGGCLIFGIWPSGLLTLAQSALLLH